MGLASYLDLKLCSYRIIGNILHSGEFMRKYVRHEHVD